MYYQSCMYSAPESTTVAHRGAKYSIMAGIINLMATSTLYCRLVLHEIHQNAAIIV